MRKALNECGRKVLDRKNDFRVVKIFVRAPPRIPPLRCAVTTSAGCSKSNERKNRKKIVKLEREKERGQVQRKKNKVILRILFECFCFMSTLFLLKICFNNFYYYYISILGIGINYFLIN